MHTPGEGGLCSWGTTGDRPTLLLPRARSSHLQPGGLLISVSPTRLCAPQSWAAELPVPIPEGLVALRVNTWRGKRLHSQGILMGACAGCHTPALR